MNRSIYVIMTSHRSEIVHWLGRRHCSPYLYIILAVWTFFLLSINIIIKLKGGVKQESNKPKYPIKVVERWYPSNRRSLLEDDDDITFNSIPLRHHNGTKIKIPKDLLEILDGTKPNNARSKEAIFNYLDSLLFGDNPDLPEYDCPGVLSGDKETILKSKLANLELHSKKYEERKARLIPSDEKVMKMAEDCEQFISDRQYVTAPLSKEEKAYPIAYIITIHRDLQAFERLLRSIYHPQNVYCVHVDAKSKAEFKSAVSTVTGCFANVFVASKLTDVRYTHWSRVEADLNCMKDLVKRKNEFPWKYIINLCGLDYPTKTNLEIVRTLKNLQGYNTLETFKCPPHKRRRFELHYDLPASVKGDHLPMKKTEIKKDPPPNNIEMFSGSAYYIFKRQAIEYILTDPVIQQFFKWNEDTYSPDEHLWATIQRMFPQVPGSFPPHEKYDLNELQTITRIIKWGGLDNSVYPKCQGRYMRGICVFGCGDLAWLVTQHHLFANKFDANSDVLVIECLDRWIRNRTIIQAKKYYARGYL